MSSKVFFNRCKKLSVSLKGSLVLVVAGMITLAGITGCGSSGFSVDLPKEFIQDFIAKHETMIDKSLVYYYVKEDQPKVAEQIDIACRINKSKGRIKVLEKATFDFSELQIELVDKKEVYVDDEPVIFAKVKIKGCYKMKLSEETQKIEANDVIVLQMARNEWKVTESNNPWS